MASIEYNISLVKGETFELPIRLKASGEYLNLTAYTPKAQIRNRQTGALVANIVCTKKLDTTGLLYMLVPSGVSSMIPMLSNDPDIPDIYVWGLVLVSENGSSTPMLHGKVYVYTGVVT